MITCRPTQVDLEGLECKIEEVATMRWKVTVATIPPVPSINFKVNPFKSGGTHDVSWKTISFSRWHA